MLMEDGANMAELHYFKGELHRLRGKEEDARIALDAYKAAKTAEGSAPKDIRSVHGAGLPQTGETGRRPYRTAAVP
jgi:hypothetical protein